MASTVARNPVGEEPINRHIQLFRTHPHSCMFRSAGAQSPLHTTCLFLSFPKSHPTTSYPAAPSPSHTLPTNVTPSCEQLIPGYLSLSTTSQSTSKQAPTHAANSSLPNPIPSNPNPSTNTLLSPESLLTSSLAICVARSCPNMSRSPPLFPPPSSVVAVRWVMGRRCESDGSEAASGTEDGVSGTWSQ